MHSHDQGQESASARAIRMARAQLGKASEELSSETPNDLHSRVHQVRKRIKKVRAYLKLVQVSVGRKSIARMGQRLRDASRPLSILRDASALIQTIDRLAERSAGLAPPEPFAEVRSALVERREDLARIELEEGQALAKAMEVARSVRRRLGEWKPGREDSGPVACLKRAYRRGRESFKAATEGPTGERLHELRKRVKALNYQLGTMDSEPSSPGARLENLSRLLAQELGEVHDLDVLRDFLEGRANADPIRMVLDRRRLDLRRSAMLRAGVIFRDKPRAFARTVEAPRELVETGRSQE